MTVQQDTGKTGENLAKEFLVNKGYTVIHENWRKGSYEIDLVAKFKGLLIFAEVKTRSYNTILEPHMAVNKAKQKSLITAANAYITAMGSQDEVRFDIISVLNGSGGSTIEHIEDAFRAYAGR